MTDITNLKIRIFDTKVRDFYSDDFSEVLRLQILVSNLQARGIDIRMIGLAGEPEAFHADAAAEALLTSEGTAAFPCLIVGDEVIARHRYVSDEQILKLLGPDFDLFDCAPGEGGCASCGRCGGHS